MSNYIVKLDTEIVKKSKELGYATPKAFINDAAKLLVFAVKHYAIITPERITPLPEQLQNVINSSYDDGEDRGYDDGYEEGYSHGVADSEPVP